MRTESSVNDGPIETKSLAEVIDEVLRDAARGIRVSEIVVSLRERGFRTDVDPVTLMRSIRDMFKRYPGRFTRDKTGPWAVC